MGQCAALLRFCFDGSSEHETVTKYDSTCNTLLQYSKAPNVSALLEIERDARSDFSMRFVLGRKLGAGAFASVYECGDKVTKKTYACKVYNRRGLGASSLECALMEPYLLKV
jgi:hypothetical protein